MWETLRAPMLQMDVICVGEALVDFLPASAANRVRDVDAWHQCPGGAPSNVAIGLARLGARVALNGVVGEDEFGHFLHRRLAEEGVDVSHLRMTPEGRTGLSFVSLTHSGERSFCFYRSEAAEQFFCAKDVDPAFVGRAHVVHFGLNAMRRPAAQEAVLSLMDAAVAAGRVVACDPNLRLHLWDELGAFKTLLGAALSRCTIVKMASDETEFVLGTTDPERALRDLHARGVALPVVSCGAAGAVFLHRGQVHKVPAPKAAVVDTTGAGDGFSAGFLYGISKLCETAADVRALTTEQIAVAASLGCRVGSHVVERLGAVAALPSRGQLDTGWPAWLDLTASPNLRVGT